jgi:hypothetical protein
MDLLHSSLQHSQSQLAELVDEIELQASRIVELEDERDKLRAANAKLMRNQKTEEGTGKRRMRWREENAVARGG